MSVARPGVSIIPRSTPPARSAPTDTGVWFVVGLADQGPLDPTLVQSLADFERKFGPRVSYSILYDALDVYFREGGSKAYVSRVVGPSAEVATLDLEDSASDVSLVATAIGPGDYGNDIQVGVRDGEADDTFVIFVLDADDNEVEASYDLVDQNAAVFWALNSSYIRLTLGASELVPDTASAASLATGDDDRANITDTEWQDALDLFVPDLGIGQVSAPGRVTSEGYDQLLDHANANRRVALLDAPDSGTVATLRTSSIGTRAGSERYGAMFAPWLQAPGVVAGTNRDIPPSALVAGLLAANDGQGLGPSTPAAGDHGEASYVNGLTQLPWSDSDRTLLNETGVNVIRTMFGVVRVYGWRSLVNPVVDPDHRDFGHARLYMAIAGQGAAIAEGFLFDVIDGQGRTIASFAGALAAMLQRFYNAGDLFGESASDAFFVDVGSQVNTPESLFNNELHAVLNVRMSPFAEFIQIEVFKKPITEGVV